ncbi:hypothetical protein FB480_103113 [Agrobacterium vitis]|nr:hypothetical protein FB480_103113 [Agrobacterium vitis]
MPPIFLAFGAEIIRDPTNFAFLCAIGAVGILGIICTFINVSWAKNIAAMAPGTTVTLGILGTFWGIAVGLMGFDVANIDKAVPLLLGGLKTAFLTSILGMGASLIIKVIQTVPLRRQQAASVTPEDIHTVLSLAKSENKENANRLYQAVEALRSAIADNKDGSLVSQLQRMRSENRDGQQELISEFRNFAEKMTESNQKALIEALKDVIRDFNEKLTEQFGENFKELNTAVHKLVDWQENYRTHIETVEDRIGLALSAIDHSQQSLQSVSDHVSVIPAAIAPLEPIMTGLNQQITVLDGHLEALVALKEQALGAFPILEKNLSSITTDMARHVDQAIVRTNESLERHTANFRTLEEGFDTLQRSASNSQQAFTSQLDKVLEAISAQLTSTITKHGDLIDQNAKSAQKVIEKAWADTSSGLSEQFKTFDDDMQKELSRAIELMGQKLAALSEKFVSDYQPLTDRLRDVVNMARSVA